jgi:hypothetical protein
MLFITGAAIMIFGLFVNLAGYYLYSWGFFLCGLALLIVSRFVMQKGPRKPYHEPNWLYYPKKK